MRLAFVAIFMMAGLSLLPLPATADSHEGIVRYVRIDSTTDAPLCVATMPGLPGGGWACIYPNRPHYQEMKEVLLRAFDAKHTCILQWSQRDTLTNRAQIQSITCSAR